MTTPVSVFSLLVTSTADAIFDSLLQLASALGLPTTTWRTGDPTRTTLRADANLWAQYDAAAAIYAASGFLDTAEGDWLALRALDTYNVTKADATYATPSVSFLNSGGGFYEIEPGGLTMSSSITGATYVNQSTITIGPGATVANQLAIAQVAGTDGTAGVNDVDTIVSPPLLGVAITSSTASLGADATSDQDLRAQCRATLGALSPNGPADAYEYVVRNSALTGVTGITRAKSQGDTDTGEVTVYAATASAGLSAPTLALLQAAVDLWAEPLCTGATVVSGTPSTVVWTIAGLAPGDQDTVEAALDAYLAGVDMGGVVALSGAYAAIVDALPELRFVPLLISVPATDVTLTVSQFPVRGAVTLV